jgi:hypothetical protein
MNNASTDKRDLYKTCRVRMDSTLIPERRGQYAAIRGHVNGSYTLKFADGHLEGLIDGNTDLENFVL